MRPHPKSKFAFFWFTIVSFVSSAGLYGQLQDSEFSSHDIEFFENKVRPLLVEHCLKCHGEDESKIRGGLVLTFRQAILEGGDSGPAVVVGKPEESLLVQSVHYKEFEMPPSGQLKSDDIETLEKWVQMGLPDPRTGESRKIETIDLEAGRKFWAFKPRQKIKVSSCDASWPKSNIDHFIYQRLVESQISPVADASREVLIRRAYITLIGLPPTPQQIDEFLDDTRPTAEAFEHVVDQLLASSHFGERWGRHWLDVARFAESSGGGRSLMFTDAWRYRDYVIDAYNSDKPFDRFVREQIAGDLLDYESHEQKIEQIIATGLLALGPTNYEQQDKELLRMEVIDEQVDTVGRAFLGLTLGCARCHDHKFDPIPMADYYALAGIFGSTESLVDGNVSKFVERKLATKEEIEKEDAYKRKVTDLSQRLKVAKEAFAKATGQTIVNTRVSKKKNRDSSQLKGIVVDDKSAKRVGKWVESTSAAYFVDGQYIHDDDSLKGEKKVVFEPKLETGGQYEVRISYSASGNRASNVPVNIDHQDGKKTILVNQSQNPPIDDLYLSLGTYRFEADNQSTVTVSNEGTDGHVIVDTVQFIKREPSKTNSEPKGKKKDAVKSDRKGRKAKAKNESSQVVEQKPKWSTQSEKLQVEIDELEAELKKLKKNAPRPSGLAMSVRESKKPEDGHIHIRGSVRNLGPLEKRGFISVCCSDQAEVKPDLAADESGRLQLAEWIASADHPLTARVYVNRVWRHLFGAGLVFTTDNFGMVGQRPSHPELLDYLANQFVENGWSTKKLIREIMLSRVYQLGSFPNDEASEIDAENRLLWRANRRRVDAEVLRDSILFVSGKLDLTPGGLTIRKLSQYDLSYEFDTVRRSVYVPAFRNSMLDVFEVFDFANPNLVIGHRNTSTLPTQALFLMNSSLLLDESKNAAERLLSIDGADDTARVITAYRQAIGRTPSSGELEQALGYLESFEDSASSNKTRQEAWASFCHALFASLEFRYVE